MKQINSSIREQWEIEINNGRYLFRRYSSDGKLNDSYRPVNQSEAAVFAACIIQGIEPPRSLCHLDIPAGQTQSVIRA